MLGTDNGKKCITLMKSSKGTGNNGWPGTVKRCRSRCSATWSKGIKLGVFLMLFAFMLFACSSSGFNPGGYDGGGDPLPDGGNWPWPDGGASDGGIGPDGGTPWSDGGVDDGGVPADGGAADGGPRCSPIGHKYCVQEVAHTCMDTGVYQEDDCGLRGQRCFQGHCVACTSGTTCMGDVVIRCTDGGYEEVMPCTGNTQCLNGMCQIICQAGKESNVGCEYWPVDLDNADVAISGGVSPRTANFAVVVSNVHPTATANIIIYKNDGNGESIVAQGSVAARRLEIFNLGARNVIGSMIGYKAFRLVSNQPVIAYQFNPMNNTEAAFSNDASLLLPTRVLDREYIAVTGDAIIGSSGNWGAFVTVVGISSLPTQVTITVPNGIAFDPPSGANVSGQQIRATLNRYQVLSVSSRPAAGESSLNPVQGGGNMSGTRVVADYPVAVYSGNVATLVPHGTGQTGYADHMEEQIFPLSSWGTQFVAARSLVRRPANPEPDYWRITASQNGTSLTYRPSRPSGAPATLNAGASMEFKTSLDFTVESTKPIMLTHFLTSSNQVVTSGSSSTVCVVNQTDCSAQTGFLSVCNSSSGLIGTCLPVSDPSMTLIPPIQQFRQDYVFLTPLDYATDFVNIVLPQGATAILDNNTVTGFTTIGTVSGVTYQKATVEVSDGVHTLTTSAPAGVFVYGYDRDVSYGYPGGLNLGRINQ